ncbi:MAG: transcription elongation factor GreA [Thermoguttaceae bacterium]|nr:transcription elongation factor GreA [Thermoguttaceae bacterium]
MSDPIPMTREAYKRLKDEIERLEKEELPPILERLAAARAEGDLSENAEYHGARESQGLLMAKISDLKSRAARAQIVDMSLINHDEIRFGATIVVKRLRDDKTITYQLVGAGDEDFAAGKILVTSPLGKGFLGKKVNEIAEIKVPAGINKYEILEVKYDE